MRGTHAGLRHRWLLGVAIFVLGFVAVVAACGLDDTAIPMLGMGEDASIFAIEASIDANDDAPVCIAKTCVSFPGDCHPSIDAGCGQTVDCFKACPDLQACVTDAGAGVDGGYFCNGAPVCEDAGEPGGNCNTLTNVGNGLTTSCGNCTDTGFMCTTNTCGCSGTTCGGPTCCSGAMPNCNDNNNGCCLRKACADDRTQCSLAFSDGCGSTLNCQSPSNCTGGQVCDTASAQCCTVTTTCGTKCNTSVMTNCGTSLPCNACVTGTCDNTDNCCLTLVCGGVCCLPTQTECNGMACCAPDPVGTTCNNLCGTSNDNCGVPTSCGPCQDGDTCAGAATCPCGTATCNPGQKCHRGPPGDHCP